LVKERQEKQVCKAFLLFASLYKWVNASLNIQKLSAKLELEQSRANRAVTELASAKEMIEDLQLRLW
jgi:predicted transcriptional regulator